MNQFKTMCPSCFGRVVWAFFFPKVATDYCCNSCGHTWNKTPHETGGQYGTYLGDWGGHEMTKLEEDLSNHSPYIDWTFFKGECIWTAWHAPTPEHLIVSKTLDELIYWIIQATNNRNWYEIYLSLADNSSSKDTNER